MVARATRRARHAGRSPLTTRDQTRPGGSGARRPRRGRPCRPRSGSPIAAANSVTENSPISGCTGSGDRHPGLAVVPHRGRLSRESTECIAAQATAACSFRPPRRRRGRSCARANSSTAAAVSRSAGLPGHALIPAPSTDTQAPKTGFSTGVRETFSRSFSARCRARPRPGLDELDHRGGVVSTGSTTEGWRGLDRLDHRGLAWSRQARPPRRPGRRRRLSSTKAPTVVEAPISR